MSGRKEVGGRGEIRSKDGREAEEREGKGEEVEGCGGQTTCTAQLLSSSNGVVEVEALSPALPALGGEQQQQPLRLIVVEIHACTILVGSRAQCAVRALRECEGARASAMLLSERTVQASAGMGMRLGIEM